MAATQKVAERVAVADFENAAELASETPLIYSEAEGIVTVLERRSENRASDETAYVLLMDDWVETTDIADSSVLLASSIFNHSSDAYKIEGAHEIQMELLDEAEEEYLTRLVKRVDDTDGGYVDVPGERFLPKSAVYGVYDLQP